MIHRGDGPRRGAKRRRGQLILAMLGLRTAIGFPMTVFGAATTARQRFALNNTVAIVAALANGLVSAYQTGLSPTQLAGWGPGLAIVLAVKGLGRYPELRNQEDTGAAERFIIGTFTSVLWAAACAGMVALVRG